MSLEGLGVQEDLAAHFSLAPLCEIQVVRGFLALLSSPASQDGLYHLRGMEVLQNLLEEILGWATAGLWVLVLLLGDETIS